MPITQKVFSRRNAPTTQTTLYTVPASTTAVVTNIVVANSGASAETVTVSLDGIPIISGGPINSGDSIVLDIRQVLPSGNTISAVANSTDVKLHISGVEIS
jgi:hypothetical protein